MLGDSNGEFSVKSTWKQAKKRWSRPLFWTTSLLLYMAKQPISSSKYHLIKANLNHSKTQHFTLHYFRIQKHWQIQTQTPSSEKKKVSLFIFSFQDLVYENKESNLVAPSPQCFIYYPVSCWIRTRASHSPGHMPPGCCLTQSDGRPAVQSYTL